MRLIGHAWSALVNLFALLVLFGMLSVAHTAFETVVVSMLALIYINLNTAFTTIARNGIERAQATLAQFISLSKHVGDSQIESYESAFREAVESYKRITVRFYINLGFSVLMWIIAGWSLIDAVL